MAYIFEVGRKLNRDEFNNTLGTLTQCGLEGTISIDSGIVSVHVPLNYKGLRTAILSFSDILPGKIRGEFYEERLFLASLGLTKLG